MRKNQLKFELESFGDQSPDGKHSLLQGEIDGNSLQKTARDMLYLIHECYSPEGTSFRQFMNEIAACDDSFGRFGAIYKDGTKIREFGSYRTSQQER